MHPFLTLTTYPTLTIHPLPTSHLSLTTHLTLTAQPSLQLNLLTDAHPRPHLFRHSLPPPLWAGFPLSRCVGQFCPGEGYILPVDAFLLIPSLCL
ncbi:hypothetical protein E2C01_083695 [Portunus trituberculatus]|uniref:Uncharacterized protein n=1 Tax=Portunus trituberculatus TaxID=210409 RepID=A0A5B7J8Q0_PORTR|nr:hypothetical protein [Portunus trituberculatus]